MGKPITNYRCGSVQCTAWENESDGKKYNSFSFKRSYKDKSGKWMDTTNFKSNDLMDLSVLATEMNTMFRVRELEQKKKASVEDMGECGGEE